MMTTEQLVQAMDRLPDRDLLQLKEHLEKLLEAKRTPPVQRGDRIRALAGAAHVGRVLDPLPSRESLYEEASE